MDTTLNDGLNNLGKDARRFRADASATAQALKEAGMASAKHALADGSAQVQRQAREAAATGDNYVRTQPWQAVGIAAAAGLPVGFPAGRR